MFMIIILCLLLLSLFTYFPQVLRTLWCPLRLPTCQAAVPNTGSWRSPQGTKPLLPPTSLPREPGKATPWEQRPPKGQIPCQREAARLWQDRAFDTMETSLQTRLDQERERTNHPSLLLRRKGEELKNQNIIDFVDFIIAHGLPKCPLPVNLWGVRIHQYCHVCLERHVETVISLFISLNYMYILFFFFFKLI